MSKQKPGIIHSGNSTRPILSFHASQDLGIVKIVLNVETQAAHYKTKYAKVFSGLGCFSKPYRIMVDKATPPTVVPPRNLPAALRDRVKSTLDEMEHMKVIRRVDDEGSATKRNLPQA